MRWTVARKLGLLSAVALAGTLAVAGAGWIGTATAQSVTHAALTANQAQAHQAEVDAVHNTVMADALMVVRQEGVNGADFKAARDALTADEKAIAEKVQALRAVNLDAAVNAAAEKLLVGTRDFVAQTERFVALRGSNPTAVQAGLKAYQSAFDSFTTQVDDVTTLVQKTAAARASSANGSTNSTRTMILAVLLLAFAGVGFVAWRIARAITRPLGRSVASLDALAAKDLTQDLQVETTDETARMAESLNTALVSLRAALTAIAGNSQTLAAASEELLAVSTDLGTNAEETSTQSTVVSAAGEQVSLSVQSVATAVEEMTASIGEIAQDASVATQVAGEAVEIANLTNTRVAKLGESSQEITDVIKVITSIAEQTNLLALNATIEAARAGESGKGFAVVANEVKELANETAKATDDIARRIEAVQTDTGEAVDSITKITEIVGRINDIQSTIASAVEEQAATTNEIGRSIAEAAQGTGEIADNISGVARAATSTAGGVGAAQEAAQQLSQMSTELHDLVSEFRY